MVKDSRTLYHPKNMKTNPVTLTFNYKWYKEGKVE